MVDIDRAELAALDAAPQDRGDQTEPATHHLVEVEARELRKVAGLGDHQLGDGADLEPTTPEMVSNSRSSSVALGPSKDAASASTRARFGNRLARTTASNSSSLPLK